MEGSLIFSILNEFNLKYLTQPFKYGHFCRRFRCTFVYAQLHQKDAAMGAIRLQRGWQRQFDGRCEFSLMVRLGKRLESFRSAVGSCCAFFSGASPQGSTANLTDERWAPRTPHTIVLVLFAKKRQPKNPSRF